MESVVSFVLFSLLFILDGIVPVRSESFLDAPPPEYNNRTTLKDCIERFYSDVEEYNGGYGDYGGFRALPGEFPHMVAIGWTRAGGKIDYLCGGSLISRQFVLTAAYCTSYDNIEADTVRLGDTDLTSTEDNEFAQQIPIARMIVHPRYMASRKYFEVALIELQQMVQFTEAVCSACLWQEKDLPDGPMIVTGFGVTIPGEGPMLKLKRLVLSLIDQEECKKTYTKQFNRLREGLREDQFCAAGNSTSSCAGDGGGPIGVKRLDVGGTAIPLVTGIVSFGFDCSVGSIDVYTKVSEYIEWIERTTNTSHSYAACIKNRICIGRSKETISVNFERIYTRTRFGLLWTASESPLWECGATLIHYQFFLTTASCVTTYRGHPKYVISTAGDRSVITDVTVSPLYNAGRLENDIALLKIEQYANHAMHRPACLWSQQTNGKWPFHPKFSAYTIEGSDEFVKETIIVTARNGTGCEDVKMRGTDMRCFHNQVDMMPGVCRMDHGGPVLDNSDDKTRPIFMYGIVSSLSKACGSNLYMINITPHIAWIEEIIVG